MVGVREPVWLWHASFVTPNLVLAIASRFM